MRNFFINYVFCCMAFCISKGLDKECPSVSSNQRQSEKIVAFKDFLKQNEKPYANSDGLKIIFNDVASDDDHAIRTDKSIKLRQSAQSLQITADVQCLQMPMEFRFDCHPESEPTSDTCEARGCCYNPVQKFPNRKMAKYPNPLLNVNDYEDTIAPNSLGVPACYFPNNFVSYNFTSLTQTENGLSGTLARTTYSGFPDDIMQLKIDFIYETNSRIRIKIYDPANLDRWETPFPAVPEPTEVPADLMYSVIVEESRGTFAILRTDNDIPLFDTRKAGSLTFADQFLQISSMLTTNYIYGLGQHLDGLLLDTYWQRHFLWNYDTGPKPYVNLYGSHPFYINMEVDGRSHGVFLLNSNGIDVILQPTPAVTFRPIGGIIDLYVFLGPTPNDIIQQYTDVIGKPFLPPYWSLGYHQCRYDYYTTNRTKEIWQQTVDAEIPFDVQWNDIDSMDVFKDFTVDPIAYEGLAQFIDEVHAAGMHYVVVTDPALDSDDPEGSYYPYSNGTQEGIFIMSPDGQKEFIGLTWIKNDSVWPDFTFPRTHQLWEEYIRTFLSEFPFDGLWLDMNEPSNFDNSVEACNASSPLNSPPYLPPNSEQSDKWLYYRTVCMDAQQKLSNHYNLHNLYGVLETMATSNALKNVREKRPFVISRSSYPGHGSYAGHWTGDTSSKWFQLWLSISDIINFNLFGVPMVGADICGFGENTTIPLCTRWYQVGAFYPFARNHNNEYNMDQDPVSLGEPVLSSAKNSLRERYLLLPYLYSLFFRASQTGEPVVKPLFFEFPHDKNTYVIDSEFLWGEGLLFTPVLTENATTVNAYFPAGQWYDWYTGSLRQQGSEGQFVTIDALDLYPNIWGRGGYIIPTQTPGVTTTESRQNEFRIEVFLDEFGSSKGELFWDDGDSLDTIPLKQFNTIKFTSSNSSFSSIPIWLNYQDAQMPLDRVRVMGVEDVNGCWLDSKTINCDFDSVLKVLSFTNLNVTLKETLNLFWG